MGERRKRSVITVMVFEPGKAGELREIDDSLEALQKVVGGYIEHVTLAPRLAAICNEHGKLDGLPANRWGFVGTFFMTRHVGENYVSLTEEDHKIIGSFVSENRRLVL
jgi:hypothetical protein